MIISSVCRVSLSTDSGVVDGQRTDILGWPAQLLASFRYVIVSSSLSRILEGYIFLTRIQHGTSFIMAAAIPTVASAPPFRPTVLPENIPSPLSVPTAGWTDLLVSSCHFGRAVFLSTLKDLCLHPERNSSLILRADPLPPRPISPSDTPEAYESVEEVHVRLMPRQPKRDGRLEQRCLFFRSDPDPVTGKKEEALVMYLPQVRSRAELPFYYPGVKGLAYKWEAVEPDLEAVTTEPTAAAEGDEGYPVLGRLTISYLPWPDEGTGLPETDTSITPSPPACLSPERAHTPKRRSPLAAPPIDANGEVEPEETPAPAVLLHPIAHSQARRSPERIARICHVLLETVYKHGFGRVAGYKKRVNHDVSHFVIYLSGGNP